MFKYDVIFTDGTRMSVNAASRDAARNQAYRANRSGVIVDIHVH